MNTEPELTPGVNHQTGTSYTIQHSDREKLVTFSNAGAVAVTVPQAIGAFGTGFRFRVLNLGAGTVTFTPATSTVNGSATLALLTNQPATWDSDGTNWDAEVGPVGAAGAAGTNGLTILNGAVDPTTEGVNGDFYINTANNKIFGPKAAGSWPAGVSLIGPTGAAGATGPAGTGYSALEAKKDQFVNNITTLQSLCEFTGLTAGLLNTVTKRLVLRAKGFFTTAGGETPQLTFDTHMAAASQAAIQTDALTAGVTGAWWLEFEFLTLTTGVVGTLYRSGKLHIQLAGSSTVTTYIYAPTSATSGIDLTGVVAPMLTITATSNLGTIRGTICSLKVE